MQGSIVLKQETHLRWTRDRSRAVKSLPAVNWELVKPSEAKRQLSISPFRSTGPLLSLLGSARACHCLHLWGVVGGLVWESVSKADLLSYNFDRKQTEESVDLPLTKRFIIHLREKCIKHKIISMCSHPKFVSRLFLKTVKKPNCIENIRFWGVLLQFTLLLQFHRYNKINDFISFTMTRSGVSHSGFPNSWKIKNWEADQFFFSKNTYFFVLRVFTGKRSNIQKEVCDGLGNLISFKMMSVSVSYVKICRRSYIFSSQKCTFQGGVQV